MVGQQQQQVRGCDLHQVLFVEATRRDIPPAGELFHLADAKACPLFRLAGPREASAMQVAQVRGSAARAAHATGFQ